MFCHAICDDRNFFATVFDGKHVIELGAGTGLVSVLVDKLFSCGSICVTDLDSHVELIRHNLELNRASENCQAQALDWQDCRLDPYDVVLIFECVYNESLYDPLIQSLDQLFSETTVGFLGLTRLFAKPSFFDKLLNAGFVYTMVPEESLPAKYSDDLAYRDVGLFVVRRVSSTFRVQHLSLS